MRRPFMLFLSSVMALTAMADDVRIYEEHFAKGQPMTCSVVDANADGVTWARHTQSSWFGPDIDFEEMVYGSSAATVEGDDWLLTPALELRAGQAYSFTVKARTSFDGFAQRMEVWMGQGNAPAALTRSVLPSTLVSSSDMTAYSAGFVVEADGAYVIGVRATSEARGVDLYVDDLVLTCQADALVPAAVSQFTVEADDAGQGIALLSYTAPTLTVDGRQLTGLLTVEIERDGALIHTQRDVQPGSAMTWQDYVPHVGTYQYSVTPCASARGVRSTADPLYVGPDTPLPPTSLALTDEGERVILTWQPAPDRGVYGRAVGAVTYAVLLLDDSYAVVRELGRTADLTFAYDVDTRHGGQDILRLGVVAVNAAGWGEPAVVRQVMGCPYTLPFHESFATAAHKTLVWQEGDASFAMTSLLSADGDYGCIGAVAAHDGQQGTLCLGKVAMRQALAPVLSLQYQLTGAADRLDVSVVLPDGSQRLVASRSAREAVGEGWQSLSVDLSAFAGVDYVIPRFAYTGGQSAMVLIDAVSLSDPYDYDLSLDLDAPDTLAAVLPGDASLTLTVSNVGRQPVPAYEVELLADGHVFAHLASDGMVGVGEARRHVVVCPEAAEGADVLQIEARLTSPYDLSAANDVASRAIRLTGAAPVAAPVSAAATGPSPHRRSRQELLDAAATVLATSGHPAAVSGGSSLTAPVRDAAVQLDFLYEGPVLSVVGRPEGGYAVVTTDALLPAVVGYSSASYTDARDNEGFAWWWRAMEAAVSDLSAHGEAASLVAPRAPLPSHVPQLLRTVWGQMGPYNDLCPVVDGRRTLVGCVATAATQILCYHQYPAQGTGRHADVQTTDAAGHEVRVTVDFADYHFDYDQMLPTYTAGSYTEGEARAVAELSFAVGASFGMMYGAEASGTFSDSAAVSLREHLGYPDARLVTRGEYLTREWMDLIFTELAEGCPLMYSGADDPFTLGGGGHAFVLDGYDERGLVHVNWGWYGSCDGYYDVSLLNPRHHSFVMQQDMVIGCRPPRPDADATLFVHPEQLTADGTLPAAVCRGSRAHRVVLPDGVLGFEDGAFADCPHLQEVIFPAPSAAQRYVVIGDAILSANGRELVELLPYYYNDEEVESGYTSLYRVPDGVRRIRDHALDGCFRLRGVALPATVDTVGAQVLRGATTLRSVIVERREPPVTLPDAFAGVNVGYTRLVIPAGQSERYRRAGDWRRFFALDNVTERGTDIRARSAVRREGEPNPRLTYEVLGEWMDVTPELSCEADASSPAGRYPIRVSLGQHAAAQGLTLTDGTLTILPPVSAIEEVRDYAAPTPAYTLQGRRVDAAAGGGFLIQHHNITYIR